MMTARVQWRRNFVDDGAGLSAHSLHVGLSMPCTMHDSGQGHEYALQHPACIASVLESQNSETCSGADWRQVCAWAGLS